MIPRARAGVFRALPLRESVGIGLALTLCCLRAVALGLVIAAMVCLIRWV